MARILVAEDDVDHAEFLRRALVNDGHEITVVNNGAEALRALHHASHDLLLADIKMPVLDGVALTLKATQEFPELRVILMTGYAEERRRAANLKVMISDLVAKPFTAGEICQVVARTLANN